MNKIWRTVWCVTLVFLLFGCGQNTVSAPTPVPEPPRAALPVFLAIQATEIPMLMYHHVGTVPVNQKRNAIRNDLTVSSENFEAQLNWLQQNDYGSVLFMDAVHFADRTLLTTTSMKKPVVLTFDDGYDDAYTRAFPLLKKYGFTGTFAVITGKVGEPEYLTWDQILEMRRGGMEFVSHTVSHPDLRILPADKLKKELTESKNILEEKLGVPISGFIYPSGEFNEAVIRALKEAGYAGARTTELGVVKRGTDPYRMPTLRIHQNTTLKKFIYLMGTR